MNETRSGALGCGVLSIPFYELCAFADRPFHGNPAAVCIVDSWPTDDLMQLIAAENGLSETAYLLDDGGQYHLRWFSPEHEVDLCGHATLAAGWVVLTQLHPGIASTEFATRSGILEVKIDDQSMLHLRLPAYDLTRVDDPPRHLVESFAGTIETVLHSVKNFYVILNSEDAVRTAVPDLASLALLHPNGVSVSAAGSNTDFVSRYFAPSYGIDEDPVSGHPHCALVPYWAARLGRNKLRAAQLSTRGGQLLCELKSGQVLVAGYVAHYRTGEIRVPAVAKSNRTIIEGVANHDVHTAQK